jgi:mRNA interferase HigB
MWVVGRLSLESFWKKHPQAENPLRRWVNVVEGAAWCSFADVRRTFGTADLYHEGQARHVVFNLGGNKFRLTAAVQYARKNIQGTIVILRIETHPEYNRR